MTQVRTTAVVDDAPALVHAKTLVLREGHTGRAGTGHISVVIVTQVRTTAVIDRALVLVDAESLILRQDHVGRTGAGHIAVLVITQVGTAAVVLQALIRVRAYGFVLGQEHAGWAGAGRPAVLVMTEMRASAVVDRTGVYLDARLAVVRQQLVIDGTRALDAAVRVRAEMGTTAVVLDALVNVLAGRAVLADAVSRGTDALVGAVPIRAAVRAGIARLRTLVHILAGSIVRREDVSCRTPTAEAVRRSRADALVGAAVIPAAGIDTRASRAVDRQLVAVGTLASMTVRRVHAYVAAIVRRHALVHMDAGPIIPRVDREVLRTVAGVAALVILAHVRAVVQSPRALVYVDAGLAVVQQLVPRGTDARENAVRVHAIVGATGIRGRTLNTLCVAAGPAVVRQTRSRRTLAIISALGIDARVAARV